MRILHVAEVLKGGVASYLDEVLAYQRAALGSSNSVAAIIPQSQLADLTIASKIKTYPFSDTGRRISHFFTLFRKLRTVTVIEQPDVIHAHSSFAGAACRLAFALHRNPPAIVYCSHGWAFDREASFLKNAAFAAIERILSWWTDKIICISEHDRQSGLRAGISSDKLVTILNGIADVSFQNLEPVTWASPDKIRVLFVGRFDRQKGVDTFFTAMSHLQSHCDAYAIGGAALGDQAIRKEPPPNVRLTGWLPRKSVQTYLHSCDVFVMPSRWEGFGLAALEAMRAGKMVVASKVGGLAELVEDGRTGVLIPPNDVAALVTAIQKVNKSTAHLFGAMARERFLQSFTSDRMNKSILNVYTEITGKPVAAVEFS